MKQMKFKLQDLPSRDPSQIYTIRYINYSWLGSLSLLILTFSFITFALAFTGIGGLWAFGDFSCRKVELEICLVWVYI